MSKNIETTIHNPNIYNPDFHHEIKMTHFSNCNKTIINQGKSVFYFQITLKQGFHLFFLILTTSIKL